ncbi:MAG: DUF6766 family protein [Actinomycetota bacterium]
MGEKQEQLRKKRPLGNYGLSIVLTLLFLGSWVAQAVSQWKEFESQQQAHGEPAEVREFGWEFAASTMENWQSEFLQLLTFVVLTSVLYHKGSAESKDGEEEIQAALERIEERLDRLEPSGDSQRDDSPAIQPL